MIRVAAGEKLQLAQKDVTLTGWAWKAASMRKIPFATSCPPSAGVTRYRPPAEASDNITVRNDTGVRRAARSRSITIR
jgi:propionyl-CoA carboxylase alpha chain